MKTTAQKLQFFRSQKGLLDQMAALETKNAQGQGLAQGSTNTTTHSLSVNLLLPLSLFCFIYPIHISYSTFRLTPIFLPLFSYPSITFPMHDHPLYYHPPPQAPINKYIPRATTTTTRLTNVNWGHPWKRSEIL